MSNPPIQISTDLSTILERIESKIEKLEDKIDKKFDNLQQEIIDLKTKDIAELRNKDIAEIKVGQAKLEEKVEGLSQRIDNQEFVSRGVLIGLIVAIAGGAAKLFGFIGNP